jgi:hypothetical protein
MLVAKQIVIVSIINYLGFYMKEMFYVNENMSVLIYR